MSIAERLAISPELRDTTQWERPREKDIAEEDTTATRSGCDPASVIS